MKTSLEDLLILHNQLVSFGRSGKMVASRFLAFNLPATDTASTEHLDQLVSEMRAILAALSEGAILQFHWCRDENYTEAANAYFEATNERNPSRWAKLQRNAIYARYVEATNSGQLLGERLYLVLQFPVNLPHWKAGQAAHLETVLQASVESFEEPMNQITHAIERLGGEAVKLDEAEMLEAVYRYWNPGTHPPHQFFESQLQSSRSALEISIPGDVVEDSGAGLYCGGHRRLLALSQLPQMTCAGMMNQLTAIPIRDFSITVNLRRLDPHQEIDRAESLMAKLQRARRSSSRSRMDCDIAAAGERIHSLQSGEITPMNLQMILSIAGESPESLDAKQSALTNTLMRMQGARTYEVALPTLARNCFFAAMPGSGFYEKSFWHSITDLNATHLIP